MNNKSKPVRADVLQEVINYLEKIVLPDRHRIIELFEKREQQLYATPDTNKNQTDR